MITTNDSIIQLEKSERGQMTIRLLRDFLKSDTVKFLDHANQQAVAAIVWRYMMGNGTMAADVMDQLNAALERHKWTADAEKGSVTRPPGLPAFVEDRVARVEEFREKFYCWLDGQSGRFVLQGKELHCGDCFQIRTGDAWHDVRIEMAGRKWYLHGVPLGCSTEPDAYEARLYSKDQQ